MKIIKYPYGKSEKEYIKEKILYKNMRCPFDNSHNHTSYDEYDWYKRELVYEGSSLFWFFGTKKHFGKFCFKCEDCGAEWESESYEI